MCPPVDQVEARQDSQEQVSARGGAFSVAPASHRALHMEAEQRKFTVEVLARLH